MTSTTSPNRTWPTTPYHPRHSQWPYHASDFTRQDPRDDAKFYHSPRFVTHIDEAAIFVLKEYYHTVLPRQGRLLDFCSSWTSHYPTRVEESVARGELKIIGVGMNGAELDANPMLNHGRIVRDLNSDEEGADVGQGLVEAKVVGEVEEERLDASTNVVSIDYLTRPVEVLRSLRGVTKMGGSVHLVISNRCFPTKAIGRWLRVDEGERVLMVGDFLHFAGWQGIEIVELSNGNADADRSRRSEGRVRGLMSFVDTGHRDPLWVVRAVKR